MYMATITVILTLLFLMAVLVGTILLQIFLSRRKSRWPGLILPGLTFLYSLLSIFSMAALPGATALSIAGTLVMTLLLSNIPTLILLAIYFACREKQKRNRQLDKMNIQDL